MEKMEKMEKTWKRWKRWRRHGEDGEDMENMEMTWNTHLRWNCPSKTALCGGSLTQQGPPVGSTILSAYLCYMGQAEKRRCGSQPPGQ